MDSIYKFHNYFAQNNNYHKFLIWKSLTEINDFYQELERQYKQD